MKGLKLIRHLEAAGLLNWFPEDGKPVVTVSHGAIVRHWTAKVWITEGVWIGCADSPDDPVTMIMTQKGWDALCA